MPLLSELSKEYAKKQPKMVDNLLEEAPILSLIDFEESTHDMWNIYDEVKEVTGAGFVNLDSELPTLSSKTVAKQVDLSVMGGQIEVGEDKAKLYGGREKYFASKMPLILKQTGVTTERAILYNNLFAFAKKYGLLTNATGTSAAANYIILVVRFESGVTTGLYSPKGFNQGTLLNVAALSNGALYKIGSGINGYGLRLKGYFGFQIASKTTVHAIVNIDKDHIPTEAMIDDAISEVRGSSTNTYIMAHDKCLTLLNGYKGKALTYSNGDKEIDRRFARWNGVPFISSYNFNKGTEAKVTVS